jgi:hypothetical protein
MAILSAFQIAALAKEAGFPASQIPTAVAIALAESGGSTSIVSRPNSDGSVDKGLWQINSKAHADLLSRYDYSNPHDNAKMAFIIYSQAGNRWTPWTTFNTGSYRLFLNKGSAGAGNPLPVTGSGSGVAATNAGFSLASFTQNASKAGDGGLGWFTRIVLFFVGLGIIFQVLKSILNRAPAIKAAGKIAKTAAVVAK